jgi:CBS domain-containing protein
MRVQDVMTTDVATVRPGTSLKEVAGELARLRISGMPVVDDGGRVVGVISEADILAKEQPEPAQHTSALARLLNRDAREQPSRADAIVTGEAMSSPATTIEAHLPVSIAAQEMTERRIKRLPVVQNERLIGIVTRADLVRAFARSDEQIAADVRETVALQQESWNDDQPVEVTIASGAVTLAGNVLRHEEALLLIETVRAVPGVAGVHSRLTWSDADKPLPAHPAAENRPWRT